MIPIGQVAGRVGIAVSAVRFYEERGLIRATRTAGGQRLFPRHVIRRLSLILIAQQLGFSLQEIGQQLAGLPDDRPPGKADWTRVSQHFGRELDKRIALMTQMRNQLDSCIGCGCLSLKSCGLYNPQDQAATRGTGPHFLTGKRD